VAGLRRGLVHRDISPNNVLLSWEGEVKLADFGVAQMLESTMTAAAHVTVGKPGYMSPEQVNRQELDGRSDLYAVGVVLWELLAHRRLRVEATGDITASAVWQTIPRPSEYRQGVPADLEAIAMRVLAYDREERYQTARLAALDLMRCQDSPRDGRGDLARLLEDRFPCSRRQHPNSRPPAPSTSRDVCTVTEPPVPVGAPPWPRELVDSQRLADMLDRARSRRRALTWNVLLVVLVAAAIAFLLACPWLGHRTTT
jgi:serine/threonine protein kinase